MSHSDIEALVACLASTLRRSDLSARCKTVAIDLLDEITGQIEQDQIEQRDDVPGFERTYAELDALTIRVVR